MFSENSPSYELPTCCDVMGLSNLITVPDCWLHVQQEAISQKEMVFRFRKDIQSEKGWRFDILCMRSPGMKGICADALLCDSLSCQSLRFVVEARYSTEPIQ